MRHEAWPSLHERIGNTQHLPQAVPKQQYCINPPGAKLGVAFYPTEGMVMLAALACVELFEDLQIQSYLPSPCLVNKVQADGLCFWSCLYVHLVASKRQQYFWFHRSRNLQGIPLDSKQAQEESRTVREWALQIGEGSMPEDVKKRIQAGESAQHEDIDACCPVHKRHFYCLVVGKINYTIFHNVSYIILYTLISCNIV